jgi:hypothetical protein
MFKTLSEVGFKVKIAFGHKMGVGKDTACSHLINKYGGKHLSFAMPLYDIQRYAQQKCGFLEEKDRQFLQYIGTEWARNKDPDVWVRLALQDHMQDENIFLSDLRFKNEFYALKKDGWFCVKIVRPQENQENQVQNRKGTGRNDHESETSLDAIDDKEWNYIIYNDKSIQDFYNNLDNLYLNIWRSKMNNT